MQGLTGAETITPLRLGNTASAASLTLPTGPYVATYPITGTTPITSITAGLPGQIAILEFQSAGCQVVSGSNLKLAGDYYSTTLGVLVLHCDGTNWIEEARAPVVVSPLHNALVNGDFTLWQRGTSFAAIANLALPADMWHWDVSGTGVVTIAQSASVPAVAANAVNTPYSLLVTPTTADASIAAGDHYDIFQTVEGYNYRALTNGFALSFWVKAHLTGTYCVAFRNLGVDRSYVAEYTVNGADTWEYKTVVVPAPPTAGTWNYTNGVGLYLNFTLAGGSSFQAAANAWVSSNSICTANQVNALGATADTFSLALVNLVPGAVPLPLAPLPIELMLERAQRYYEIHGGATSTLLLEVYNSATSFTSQFVPFRVKKGGQPTLTLNGTWATSNANQPTVGFVGVDGYALRCQVVATGGGWIQTNSSDDSITAEWNP